MTATVQKLVIPGWHPPQRLNSQANRHWSAIQKQHDNDAQLAFLYAKSAGWQYVEGKVRVTMTFVYPRWVRVDLDNLMARCKGVLDGLRTIDRPARMRKVRGRQVYTPPYYRKGFFADDDAQHCIPAVGVRIEKGVKALEIELEAAV